MYIIVSIQHISIMKELKRIHMYVGGDNGPFDPHC